MPWDYGQIEDAFWSPLHANVAIAVVFTHSDGRTWRSTELTLLPARKGGRGVFRHWLHQTMRVRHDELEAADLTGLPKPGYLVSAPRVRTAFDDADLLPIGTFVYDPEVDRPAMVVAYQELRAEYRDAVKADVGVTAARVAMVLARTAALAELARLGG